MVIELENIGEKWSNKRHPVVSHFTCLLNSNVLILVLGSFGEFLIINVDCRDILGSKWK